MIEYLNLARQGRTDWWRYIVTTILAVLIFSIFIAIGVILLIIFGIFSNKLLEAVQSPKQIIAFFIANGLIFLLLMIGFWISIYVVHKKRVGDVIGTWNWMVFSRGFLLWCSVLSVLSALDILLSPKGFWISANSKTFILFAVALPALGIQTFAEEFIFRGYLTQGLLLVLKRPLPAALISGLLFGVIHIPNGAPQAVSATFFGVVLAVIAIRFGGIAFTYGLHLANNLFGAVVLSSSSDVFRNVPALVTQNTPQLLWWDAGTGMVALLFVLWRIMRKAPEELV